MVSHTSPIEKLQRQGTSEIIKKLIGYGRGALLSLKFEKISKICVRGHVIVRKRHGSITINDYTTLWPRVKLSCVGRSKEDPAKIQIGYRCSIGDRTEIHSGQNVSIGNAVIIAWDCVIMDRDYHSTFGGMEAIRPLVIQDNVWIGCRSILLKGITVGQGAVIGAGSVVTKNVPPYTLVAGNPAKKIKQIAGWRAGKLSQQLGAADQIQGT